MVQGGSGNILTLFTNDFAGHWISTVNAQYLTNNTSSGNLILNSGTGSALYSVPFAAVYNTPTVLMIVVGGSAPAPVICFGVIDDLFISGHSFKNLPTTAMPGLGAAATNIVNSLQFFNANTISGLTQAELHLACAETKQSHSPC